MGREHSEQPSQDLFSTGSVRDTSPLPRRPPLTNANAEASPQRHVLPKNLRDAVKHLNNEELVSLHAATLGEMKRRGRLPPRVAADTAQSSIQALGLPTKQLPPTDKVSQRRRVDTVEVSLTRGQVNAVRAAFKAGITPARIARQFGISQSNVRKALATDEPKR